MTVVDTTVDEVVSALGPAVALVAGTADAVVVFAEQDEFDGFSAGLTARLLSTALGRPALEVAVFDDDLLQYQLFVDGEVVDEAALPAAVADVMVDEAGGEVVPVGSPDRLVAELGRGDVQAVAEVMATEDLVFVSDLHARLAEALSLPIWAAAWGFHYLDTDPDELPVPVVRTPS